MSKYKVKSKRRKKKGIVARYAAQPQAPKPKYSGKRALALLATAIAMVAVYVAGRILQDTEYYRFSIGVTMVYYMALPALIVVFVLINKGISNDVPTREQLSDSMSKAEKDAFIEEVKDCRRRARPLLIPIIPLALIVGFDILFEFLFAS